MKKLEAKEPWIFAVNLVVLQAFFIQLFNFPNKIATVWGILSCAVYFLLQKKVLCGIRELLLLFCLFLYVYFSGISWGQGISIVLMPVLFQIMGKYLLASSRDEKNYEKRLFLLLAVFVLGYFIHSVLNSVIYLKEGIGFHGRHWGDIWTGGSVPATQQNIYFLPMMALTFSAVIFVKKYKAVCGCILVSGVYSVWFSILSQSRTPLVIFGMVFVWGIILWLILNRKNKNIKKTVLICSTVIVLIAAVGGIIIWLNWETVQSSRMYTVLNRNGGILHNIRFEAQRNVLRQLFDYPFGGHQMDLAGLNYAHNVWLDLANAAGVVPFFLLVAYTLFAAWDVWKLLANPAATTEAKFVLTSLWISLMLYYMVEPALDATVQFIIPWTYINGLIYEYNKMRKTA